MGRRPCCSKVGLNRGAWTALEDKILTSYIKAHGEGQWRNLPKRAGLKRCGKSCRLRWLNYLRPDIKRGNISHDEEELIIRLHNLLGTGRLPGRTDNEIKNYWNTTLGKKAKSTLFPRPNGKNRISAKTSSRSRKKLDQDPPTKITRPQVVRARAIRLTRVPMNPNLPSINQNPGLQHNEIGSVNHDHHQGLELSRIHHQEDNPHDPSGINYDLSFFDLDNGDDHFPARNDDGDKGDYYVNCLSMEGALMVEDCIVGNGGSGEEEIIKDALDMDSLSFLLNSEDWP